MLFENVWNANTLYFATNWTHDDENMKSFDNIGRCEYILNNLDVYQYGNGITKMMMIRDLTYSFGLENVGIDIITNTVISHSDIILIICMRKHNRFETQ